MRHLVIMAKQPMAGQVESRLAKDIGNIGAAGFYRTLMTTTMTRLSRDERWKTFAAVTPDRAVFSHNWPEGINVFGQGSGDLGARLQSIFNVMPPGPPSGPVIIIGTDIPFITRTDIARAFKLLGPNDVILGGAGDGGYWLVGAKRSPRVPEIFGNIRWSGKHALADTLENCRGLKVGFTVERFDVDTMADYLRWREEL